MRISDWSSDVCSSDLNQRRRNKTPEKRLAVIARQPPDLDMIVGQLAPHRKQQASDQIDDLRARLRRHCVAFGLPGFVEARAVHVGPMGFGEEVLPVSDRKSVV